MSLCCCGSNGGSGLGTMYLVLLLPLLFLLLFPGQKVGVVLQTVHVWQQHLRRFQRHHVLRVIFLIPCGKNVQMGSVGVQGNSRGGGGGDEGTGEQREGWTGREGRVIRDPVPIRVRVPRVAR